MSEQKKMKLGYNTLGTEEVFEAMLRQAIHQRTTVGFRYVEIGIAEGTTLISAANLLRDSGPHDWQAVGIDLVGGPFFDPRRFLLVQSASFNTHIEFEGRCNREPFICDRWTSDIRVMLLKSDTKRAMVGPGCVNFALIDGCHGAPCVEKDFLSIEPGMAEGGIVAFHDAGVKDQGIHFQTHCGMTISVRHALFNLGFPLLNESPGIQTRPGWKLIGSVEGDKSPGDLAQNGHGFVFFQKVKVDQQPQTPNASNTNPPTI